MTPTDLQAHMRFRRAVLRWLLQHRLGTFPALCAITHKCYWKRTWFLNRHKSRSLSLVPDQSPVILEPLLTFSFSSGQRSWGVSLLSVVSIQDLPSPPLLSSVLCCPWAALRARLLLCCHSSCELGRGPCLASVIHPLTSHLAMWLFK